MPILDLSIEDDYNYESDCESVDLQYDYTLILNNNKYTEDLNFKNKIILKSVTDHSMFENKSPSLKTKFKNTLRKIKSL